MDLSTPTTRVSAVTATYRIPNSTHDPEAFVAEVQRATAQMHVEMQAQGLQIAGFTRAGVRLSDQNEAVFLQNQVELEITLYAYSGYLQSMADDADKWRELQKKEQAERAAKNEK